MRTKIILPEVAEDKIELDLVYLTEIIVKNKLAKNSPGLLGGEFGYGVDFENDIFMMYPFCWCERENCKWCTAEEPNFYHKPSGMKAWWYKWIGRDMQYEKLNKKKWNDIMKECIDSLSTKETN